MPGKTQSDALGSRLSRRERQIMDAVYRLGKATATEIVASIPDPSTKDAIRRLIRILEEKGLLRHEVDGLRHVYYPVLNPEKARKSALDHIIRTYFRGSVSQAIAALLKSSGGELTEKELLQITSLIEVAKKEGR
jgi:BlaI family transcriptional regulator, penicillinase repressor